MNHIEQDMIASIVNMRLGNFNYFSKGWRRSVNRIQRALSNGFRFSSADYLHSIADNAHFSINDKLTAEVPERMGIVKGRLRDLAAAFLYRSAAWMCRAVKT